MKMALCSYQTLARYHEDNDYLGNIASKRKSCRAKNLDEIRARERELIFKTRFQSRSIKMLQNRRTLIKSMMLESAETAASDDFNFDQHYECEENNLHYDSNSDFNSSNYYTENSPSSTQSQLDETLTDGQQLKASDGISSAWLNVNVNNCDNYDWTQSNSTTSSAWCSPALSPAWSSSASSSACPSSSSASCVLVDGCEVPAYFLETPTQAVSSGGNNHYNSFNINSKRVHNKSYQQSYKQHQVMSSRFPDGHHLDHVKIQSEFNDFRELLRQNCFADAQTISQLIRRHWTVILGVFQAANETSIYELLNILSTLACDNLLQPDIVLHMLQNGIVYNLRWCFLNLDEGTVMVQQFLLNLINKTPRAIPYLIDLMFNSKLISEMEDAIQTNSSENIKHIIEFYYRVTEILINQILENSTPQPLIPEILILTGLTEKTLDSYGPISTLGKLITPNLIKTLVNCCLTRANQREEELIAMTLVILANSLKLAQIRSMIMNTNNEDYAHLQWTSKILCAFRDIELEGRLMKFMKSMQRLQSKAESSDPCSQGVGIDNLASRITERCEQFLAFLQQYYEPLLGKFAITLTDCCCGC